MAGLTQSASMTIHSLSMGISSRVYHYTYSHTVAGFTHCGWHSVVLTQCSHSVYTVCVCSHTVAGFTHCGWHSVYVFTQCSHSVCVHALWLAQCVCVCVCVHTVVTQCSHSVCVFTHSGWLHTLWLAGFTPSHAFGANCCTVLLLPICKVEIA